MRRRSASLGWRPKRPCSRVLEIGAGTGALTAALVQAGAEVTAFDLDPDMVAVLRSRDDLSGVDLRQGDALAFDYAAWAAGREWVAAGNLPYNVGTPLLVKLAALPQPPRRIVAMIQKDVADRLLAKPGTSQYGSLTLAIGLTMRVTRALTVPPSAFFPRPGVVSTVVVLDRLDAPEVVVRDRARLRTGRARRVRVPAQDAGELPYARARSAARAHRRGDRLTRFESGRPW